MGRRWRRSRTATRFYVGDKQPSSEGEVKRMDQDNLKHIASEVLEVVADTATKAAHAAGKAAVHAGEKAEELSIKALEAGKAGVEHAAPVVEKAMADAGKGALKLAEQTKAAAKDVGERGKEASKVGIASLAAMGADALSDVEKHARGEKIAKAAKKKHHKGKVIGWTLAIAGIGTVAYVVWRRSRPIEDPWAEEYWVDLQTNVDLPDVPKEPADADAPTPEDGTVAGDVAEAAKDAADKADDAGTEAAAESAESAAGEDSDN